MSFAERKRTVTLTNEQIDRLSACAKKEIDRQIELRDVYAREGNEWNAKYWDDQAKKTEEAMEALRLK